MTSASTPPTLARPADVPEAAWEVLAPVLSPDVIPVDDIVEHVLRLRDRTDT